MNAADRSGSTAAGGEPMPVPGRTELEQWPKRLLSRSSRLKPAVWWIEVPEHGLVLKDVSGLKPGLRWLGRWLLGRERRVLERLHGLSGVPTVVGCVDRNAFLTNALEGLPLDRARFQQRPREIAEALLMLVDALHARGVYHLDVRQRQNVLLDAEGRVALVDFGASLMPPRLLRALIGRFLAWIDRQSVLKYLARYSPEALTPQEAREVLRAQRLRRIWVVSPHRPRGEKQKAKAQLERREGP